MDVVTVEDFFLFSINLFRGVCLTFREVFTWFSTPFKVLGMQFEYTPLQLMFTTGLVAFLLAVIVKWVVDTFL